MTYERTENLKSFDGNSIFFRCYSPRQQRARSQRIDGLIVAVHGFGEHSGRYAELAERLGEKNVALATFDLRGHGKSGSRRGDAENLHAMVLDVLFVISQARAILGLASQSQLFFGLMGHNLGAVLLTYAAALLRDSCPPLLLASPLFRVRETLPGWKKFLIQNAPHMIPLLPIPMRFVPVSLINFGNDTEDEDALVRVSPRLGQILVDCADSTRARHALGLIRAPITIVGGKEDEVVDVEWIRGLASAAAGAQASVHILDGLGHNVFSSKSPGYPAFQELLMNWIDSRGVLG